MNGRDLKLLINDKPIGTIKVKSIDFTDGPIDVTEEECMRDLMREEFEDWCRKSKEFTDWTKKGPKFEEYQKPRVQLSWKAWQAAWNCAESVCNQQEIIE